MDKKPFEKADYNENMCKRVAELTKSGMCPGEAVKKAREECGMGDAKMKAPVNKNMQLNITKNQTPLKKEIGGLPTTGV